MGEKLKVDVIGLKKDDIRSKYSDERLRKSILHLRANKKMDWVNLANKISEKYNVKALPMEMHEVYQNEAAKATLVTEKGRKMYSTQIAEMEERFGDIWNTVDRLHLAAKRLLDEFEAESETDMKAYIKFLKASPQILQITREIKNQIQFISEEQDKIKLEQKNLIYSPIQIMGEVNEVLRTLVAEEKIEIKDPRFFKELSQMKGGSK